LLEFTKLVKDKISIYDSIIIYILDTNINHNKILS
jgi:hypothetical protein